MSIKGRLTGHFLGRAFLLFLMLGLTFVTWTSAVAIYLTMSSRSERAIGSSPMQTIESVAAGTTNASGTITIKQSELDRIRKAGGWLQVLDPQGVEIYSYAKPSTVPTSYPPGRLVFLRNKPSEIGQSSLYTFYSTDKGQLTWVLGSTKSWATPLQQAVRSPSVSTLGRALLGLIFASIAVALGVAWVSSGSLARPLVHMMQWLENLARGDYSEPIDRRGERTSRHPDGQFKAGFRTYREVIESLDTLTEQLGRTQSEREKLEAAREEWMTGITHDLRTPLSSVRGYADLLSSPYEFEPDEVRQYAATIAAQAGNLERLIEDFGLTFRLRANALPLDLEEVDLVDIAREAAVAVANDARSADGSVEFDAEHSPEPLPVAVDRRYIERALSNLLVNALVHNPEGTHVSVRASREAGWACLDVVDNGTGMDAATLERLFDRYYRGTASSKDASGTGLGMAIARQLVEAHGGTVSVSSEPGSGTIVRICLPLAS